MQKKGNIFFNMIIIITIIALLGIGGYAIYYYTSNYMAVKEAEEAVEEFERKVIVVALENEKEQVNEINASVVEENEEEEQQQGSSSKSRSYSTTYRGYNMVGTMQIPRTGIKVPIVDKVTINSIAAAVGVLYGPGPNEIGNTVYAAHNYRNGTFFSNNKVLDIGDKIYITDGDGDTQEYTISNVYETDANDFAYATRNTFGKREISLTTCTPNPDIRLIVWAVES
ncbi:MAG: sortase [Clostridia bacterium]|nr:sortase [Clostridia bacterium]